MNLRFDRGSLTGVLVGVVAVGIGVTDLVLVNQNRALRRDLDAATRALTPLEIRAGERLSGALGGASLDGAFRSLQWNGTDPRRTLLITFSTGCPYCRANQSAWDLAVKALSNSEAWRVLWVSRDPVAVTREYCAGMHVPLADVVAEPSHPTYLQLGMRSVPKTMVISPEGAIERVWSGGLDSARWSQLFAYVGVALPPKLRSNPLPKRAETFLGTEFITQRR